jgi:glucose/arabinose dehydrogenase
MEFAPDGRLFVTEKGGALRVISNGTLLATPFLTLNVNTDSERGLLGVTFDPNFATNRFLYVYYTTNAATPVNRVSRFTTSATNPNIVQANSELILLDNIASTMGNHNGGALHFGTDGMLYVAVGEAGVPANAQTLANLSGKILRINASNPANLIPADNPFVGVPGARGEIYALGFRNPFTFNVQPGTGKIFVNDVGQSTFEEIDQLVRGGNYGWPNAEGPDNGNPNFVDPIHFYGRSIGKSIAGGVFYQGSLFPQAFAGSYFFADFISGFIKRLPNGSNTPVDFATGAQGPVDIDVGADGSLYYLEFFTGQVKRVVPNSTRVGEPIIAVGIDAGGGPHVKVYNRDGSMRFSFFAYTSGFLGGVRTATGDVNGDGIPDIITGTGTGGAPHVKVFNGSTGSLLASFFAFGTSLTSGIYVGSGDVNNDGRADIIVGAGPGGGPHVKVFSGVNFAPIRSFFAYAPNATMGVTVAGGDVNNDGIDDIITGPGAGGGPHVKVFHGTTLATLRSFFAFAPTFTGGVFVSSGDINNDGIDDVIAGAGRFAPHVRIFNGQTLAVLSNLFVSNPPNTGIRVSSKDLNGDNIDDLVIGLAPGRNSTVSGILSSSLLNNNGTLSLNFDTFPAAFTGGIFVG